MKNDGNREQGYGSDEFDCRLLRNFIQGGWQLGW
jgi:hypothetical protein